MNGMLARQPHEFQILKCRIVGAQAIVAQSDRHFARHTHDQFGIGVIHDGAQKSASGRGPVEAGPGDVITVNPGEVHDGAPIGDAARFWQMLYFDPGIIASAVADIRQGKKEDVEFSHPVISNPRLTGTVRELFSAMTSSESGSDLVSQELLLTLLADVIDKPHKPGSVAREVHAARERIDDDPAAPVSLADLADLADMSQFQLLRAFRRATGLTPHAYLVQRRIQLARRMIATGTSLAEAAFASGFADQSHMTRIFTSSYGFSPRRFASVVL
jgi:AraC-like DNA-binding protein